MRVLWFTNIPMPAVDEHRGVATKGSGWWMSALLDHVRRQPNVQLGVATAGRGLAEARFTKDGVQYYVIPQNRWLEKAGVFEASLTRAYLRKCAAIIEDFKPDLIHVHGTERFYGLVKARGLTRVPMALSIQGLLGPCSRNTFGGLTWREILATHRPMDLVRGDCAWSSARRFRRGVATEEAVIRSADVVLGRTDWDAAQTWALAPNRRYMRVGELLRPEFHDAQWRLDTCRRQSIMVTNARDPMRGFDTILEAMVLLRATFPDVRVCLAAGLGAGSYARHLQKKIAHLGLQDRVELLGYLDAPELVARLRQSHCFVIASHMENSPNSLCEAMLVGMPCVASFVGGIPSLVSDGRSGLMFSPGDASALAGRIKDVLENDELASGLSQEARKVALERHAPQKVVSELMNAYQTLLRGSDTGESP